MPACLWCDEPGRPCGHGTELVPESNWEWSLRADAVLTELAKSGRVFTSEDITAVVGLPRGAIIQHGNNAVGALMLRAYKEGRICKVTTTASQRSPSHGAMILRWTGAR